MEIDGIPERVHVKNTGRCRELLLDGSVVYLTASDHPNRKTKYDLVAVEKQREGKAPLLINMDSQLPNAVVEEWLRKGELFSPEAMIRREVTHGDSRFDFCVRDGEKTIFLEVKGVTLEQNGVAKFPDAPTQRGIKHLMGLERCLEEGFDAYLLFVIQMQEAAMFQPNDETHPQFGEALRHAQRSGVQILAMDCFVAPDRVKLRQAVPIQL